MATTVTRRTFIAQLVASGGVLITGVVAGCGGGQAQPSAKRPPTLVPTALPTAAPAGVVRPTSVPTLGAEAKATAWQTDAGQVATTANSGDAARRDMVVVQGADVTTLDPHRSILPADLNSNFAIFDNLTFRNDDQSVVRPMLATEWKVQERRWELKLRPNVRFHNGDLLTSADVKFSIERTFEPNARTHFADVFTTLERIETPDPRSVVFITRQPDALLPARLACHGGQIVPKTYVERVGPGEFGKHPIGTGPFRFSAWAQNEQLILERFEGYWGGPPGVERAIFRPRPEPARRMADLLAGEADLVTNVPADQIDAIDRSGRARVDGALLNGLHVLAVNSRVPPLDNPLVKQALSLAIDRDTIIKSIHRGQGVVPNGLIAQGDFGFDATLPALEYNPDRAKQRLQAAGYLGEPIVLETTNGYLQGDRQMAELVDEMWRKIGINSKIESIEMSTHTEKTREKAFKGLWWSDPVSTLLDPDAMMFRLLGPGGPHHYWSNPEWERLGAEARSSLDQELRLRSYRRMNEIALEHLPWIPVIQPRRLYGISNSVEFRPYGNGYLNLRRENLRPR
jgi:peptide/nickel transport system substrate-binding protein